MLILDWWERRFFSDDQSYYIIGFVKNSYHHEISLKKFFPDEEVSFGEIKIETPIRYALRDGWINNDLRRKYTVSILK